MYVTGPNGAFYVQLTVLAPVDCTIVLRTSFWDLLTKSKSCTIETVGMEADVVVISVVLVDVRLSFDTVIVYTYVVLTNKDSAGTVATAPE